MKKLNLNAIRQHDRKISGYYDDLTSQGTIQGEFLFLEDNIYETLKNKYNTQKNFPNIVQQMKNVVTATNNVFNDIMTHKPIMANEQEKTKRLNICLSCPELSDGRCKLCGCNYSAKISIASSNCPKNLW